MLCPFVRLFSENCFKNTFYINTFLYILIYYVLFYFYIYMEYFKINQYIKGIIDMIYKYKLDS